MNQQNCVSRKPMKNIVADDPLCTSLYWLTHRTLSLQDSIDNEVYC